MTEDANLQKILKETKVIAMVGASQKETRPSFRVGSFMADRGYRVIPVIPGHAGKNLFGEKIVARMSDIEDRVDMLDIFWRSEKVLPIVEEALRSLPNLKTVWMQLDVRNAEARQLAEGAGIEVVEDRCPAIEYRRLIDA